MDSIERQQLEDKILAKRQQIEFERTNLEETKNFDDPAQNVVEQREMRSLRTAEQELNELLRQLETLLNK